MDNFNNTVIALHSPKDYALSLRSLFPQGLFWDAQWADKDSDLNLLLQAKAVELVRFNKRMCALNAEVYPTTTVDLVHEYERVLGIDNRGLPLEQRRSFIVQSGNYTENMLQIEEVGRLYGAHILDWSLPYRPSVYGHARCGERMSPLSALGELFITVQLADASKKSDAEKAISDLLLANSIAHFFYV